MEELIDHMCDQARKVGCYSPQPRLQYIIVFRDMVWKLSKLQSGFNELGCYVEPYLAPCISFV
jgi:hypothetical protein